MADGPHKQFLPTQGCCLYLLLGVLAYLGGLVYGVWMNWL